MKKQLNEIYQTKFEITKRTELPEGVLCRVKGPIAEYGAVNRNNRRYTRAVWEGVLESPYLKESLENKTFFGEADHPFDNRADSTIPLVSHCFTKLWLDGDKDTGKLMGEADILDTPSGRIIKTLVEYGSVLGISSRAFGDSEVSNEGYENIIPEGFDCSAFDFVTMPGFACARLKKNESLDRTLQDDVEAELSKMSRPELESIQGLFDSLGEEGKAYTEYISKRVKEIENLKDPVLLVEQAERKTNFYKRLKTIEGHILSTMKEKHTKRVQELLDKIGSLEALVESPKIEPKKITLSTGEILDVDDVFKAIHALDKLVDDLDLVCKERKDFQQKYKDAYAKALELRKAQKITREHIYNLKETKANLEKETSSLKEENSSLKTQLKQVQRSERRVRSQLGELREELTHLEEEKQDLLSERDSLDRQALQLRSKLDKLEEKNIVAESLIRTLKPTERIQESSRRIQEPDLNYRRVTTVDRGDEDEDVARMSRLIESVRNN